MMKERLLDLLLFTAYTVASVSGLLLLKLYFPLIQERWRSGQYWTGASLVFVGGATLYIASFLVWLVILSRNELSFSYPVAVGLTLLFSSLVASLLLHEAMSWTRIAGIVVIFAGVWLVSLTRR